MTATADPCVQAMSEYEKFLFDLKGFFVIPGVLSQAELAAVRAHIDAYAGDPDSLPAAQRSPLAGPAEFLIDHPRVMGILQEVIDPDPERVRLESVFVSRRGAGDQSDPWRPHAGGTSLHPSLSYRYHNGRIYGGMTRIVWELNEVVEGQGGTCLVPGSHKANTASAQEGNWPAAADEPDSGLWETYGCPAGSLVVFSEGVRHTGARWTYAGHARNAILIAYNHVTARFHEPKPCMNPTVIGGLTPRRQGFFKDVWVLANKRK